MSNDWPRYDGTDPDLPDGWLHDDGTPCPEYLAPVNGTRWWCTEHQQHLRRPANAQEIVASWRAQAGLADAHADYWAEHARSQGKHGAWLAKAATLRACAVQLEAWWMALSEGVTS